ncbi:nucleoside triphosphate pyrophosphohydrolase [Alteribacillus sp. HJP-4]|uniref:nucleoside triphosphate pyrophosphohydrolase n=1 Tax=Alteribacillus sp. HJP-4 TaxID=2775394 RepID=UPI0035CD2AFD
MSKSEKSRPHINIVGLGAGELDQMPLGIYKECKKERLRYVRTADHPAVKELTADNILFESFDELYEKHDSFPAVYEDIVTNLVTAAEKHGEILYAVPGHPLTAETTIQLLLKEQEKGVITANVLGGQSFLDPMFTALRIDPNDGFQLLDATSLSKEEPVLTQHVIISQLYDSMIASDVKLTLMERYPDEHEAVLVTAAGTKQEKLTRVKLFELDRNVQTNNVTALYLPPVKNEAELYQEFSSLRNVIATLRGPNGCPWDKKQTHESLKRYLLEESYEVLDAIDEEDDDHLIEELGDVLLQVMLHAQIGEDNGYFSIDDVIKVLTEKMIRRHPHVFGDTSAKTSEQVIENWEAIKKTEKNGVEIGGLLSAVPDSMPSLMKAYELQKQAAKVGFDWDDDAPMWKKLQEETAEWLEEIKYGNKKAMNKEFGDILFVLVNLGRYYKIHPEEALHMTNRKFKDRFSYIETTLRARGQKAENVSLEEMDELWEEAKKQTVERRNEE